MKNILFLVGGLLFFFTSCTQKEQNGVEYTKNLSNPVELKGTKIFEDIVNSHFLTEVDSLIIVSTGNADSLYHIYDKQQNFISSFGRVGRGPNEILFPIPIYESFENNIFIYKQLLLEWSAIDLKALVDSSKVVVNERYEFPKKLSGAMDFFYVNDSLIVGMYDDRFAKRLDQKRGVFYYYPDTKNHELLSLKNATIEPYEVMPATNVNARFPAISPDRSKLAVVSLYNPLLEIIDLKTKVKKDIIFDEDAYKTEFKLDDFKSGEEIEYYTWADATNQHIYLLHSGYPSINTAHADMLQVLTWKGNPVASYIIPEGYNLSSFFVDEKNDILYGHSSSDDQAYKFNMSN